MSDNEKKLRAELAALGVTAPTSWSEKKLTSELEKEKLAASSKPTEVIKAKPTEVIKDKPAEVIKDKPAEVVKAKPTEVIKAKATEVIKAEPVEELDEGEDLVEVVAIADFSNERLKIARMKPKQTAKFSEADAKFLVEVDRTCKYVK